MHIPTEIKHAVEQSHGAPVELLDTASNERYVVIRAEIFERLKHLFADEPLGDAERSQLLLDAGKRAGWDDPEMDVYNELDPRRKK
jgi:hypothetical protein